MVRPPRHLVALTALLLLLVASPGCLQLDPVHVPDRLLEPQSGNGWSLDAGLSQDAEGGPLSKHAVQVYRDDASQSRGYTGVLLVQSMRGLLSPDRETLRDELAQRLRAEAEDQGLELQGAPVEGQRTLSNGAASFFVLFNATGTRESFPFANDATVRALGEVFRCTGGPTVVVKAFAQVDQARSIGGFETSREYEPRTWNEIVQDPSGSITGARGDRGLVHHLVCPS